MEQPIGVIDVEVIYRAKGKEALWTPAYLVRSETDARKFLTEVQYEHAVQQIRYLCDEESPTNSALADVRPIEDFHELRDKYGVLGKINLRIYFWVCKEHKTIVVLGVCKKEAEGQTPRHIVKRMKGRKRDAEKRLNEHFEGEGTRVPTKKRE